MRAPSSAFLAATAWLLLVLAMASSGAAQQPAAEDAFSTMKEIPAGDLDYRTLTYLEYTARTAPNVVLAPGFGLSGVTFRRRVGGDPGWGKMLHERGYNAWMCDHVGVGKAQTPPDEDLDRLFQTGLFGHYQMGYAGYAGLVILHEQAAGLGLRSLSLDTRYTDAMVLIDPIGPQGAQPFMEFDPEALLERRFDPDHVWRSWGFGPEKGTVRTDLDLSAAAAESLVADYDRTQPPYWAGMLTGYDSNYEVREPMNLNGIPVLVIRTPAADAAQIEREEHVVRWMNERGMLVETFDLTEHPVLKDVSGLPWTGELAPEVLDEIMVWYEGLPGAKTPLGR